MQREFLKNLIFNNLSQGLQFGSRWILNLFLISLLIDEDFGVVAYVLAFANIFMSVLPFGSTIYLIGFLKRENHYREMGASLATILFLFVVSLLLYAGLMPFGITHFKILFLGLVLGLIYAINSIFYFYYKSLGKFGEEIKGSGLTFILVLLFIGYNHFISRILNTTEILVWICILNFIVSIYLVFFNKLLNLKLLVLSIFHSIKQLRAILKKRLYYGLQEILSVSYSQVGTFVMFYFLIEERYSVFRKLFIIIAPIYLLSVTFSQVLLHHLKKFEGKKTVKEFRKYQKLTIYGAIGLTILLFLGKDFILKTLAKLEVTSEFSMLFTLVITVSFIRFIYGNYEMLLVRLDQQKLRFWVMLAAVIVNFLSIVILVPKLDLLGAVLTELFTNFVVLVGIIMLSERMLKKSELLSQSEVQIKSKS